MSVTNFNQEGNQASQFLELPQNLDTILTDPEKHRCFQCFVPLNQLTKVITLARVDSLGPMPQSRPGDLKILCIPCFTGWSSQEIPPGQIKEGQYKVWFCRPINISLGVQQVKWTLYECLTLFSCALKYGPQVNGKFHQQFVKLTGKKISQRKLQKKYDRIKSFFFQGEESNPLYDYSLKCSGQVNAIPTHHRLIDSYRFKAPEEIKEAEAYIKILGQQNPCQNLRKCPDNHADFLARAMATSPLAKEYMIYEQDSNVIQKERGKQFSKQLQEYLNQKNDFEDRCRELNQKYCERYVKKQLKVKSQISSEDQQLQKLFQLSHPEVLKLLQDEEAGAILNKMIKLNKWRAEIKQEVQEKKKSLGQNRKSVRLNRIEKQSPPIEFQFQESEEVPPPALRDPHQVREEQQIASSEQN